MNYYVIWLKGGKYHSIEGPMAEEKANLKAAEEAGDNYYPIIHPSFSTDQSEAYAEYLEGLEGGSTGPEIEWER